MTFPIYASITAVLTVFFVISYIKQKKLFQLAFAIWIPSTLLQYLSNNRTYFNILSVVEIVLFIGVIFLLLKERKKEKTAAAQQQANEGDAE